MLPELQMHSNGELSPQAMADLELAYEAILDLPEPSIVLTKNGKIVVRATGADPSKLCSEAKDSLHAFYRSRGWIRPWQNIVAVMNFAPNLNSNTSLGGTGIDVIFALKHPPSQVLIGRNSMPGPERDIVWDWIKPIRLNNGEIRESPLRAMLFVKTARGL